MKPTIPTTHAIRWVRSGFGCCLLLVIALTAANSQQLQFFEKKKDEKDAWKEMPIPKAPSPSVRLPVEAGAVEVALTDGSNLKLVLRDEKIALDTPHGKLNIAVTDIQRIEFATRVSEEDAKRIHTAILDLGSTDFSKREAASTQLVKLRERAYPDILRAAENKDLEVVRRARELIEQIANSVPAQLLAVRPKDVVYTADSMIAGRIEGASLRAHTSQFGPVQLKLADVRSLRSQALEPELNPMNQTPWSNQTPWNTTGIPIGAKGWGGPPPGMPAGNFQGMKPGMNPKFGKMPWKEKK